MKIAIASTVDNFTRDQWKCLEDENFPFTDFDFLSALEESHCIGKATGWIPCYIYAESAEGALLGCLLLYVKNNSNGEYIFDWDWADAYLHHGIDYYPKIVSAIPFTPATGSKLLIDRNLDNQDMISNHLIAAARDFASSIRASSVHHLFVPEAEIKNYVANGYMIRSSFQYHWSNQNYLHFDSYLEALRTKKCKAILKERKEAHQLGLKYVKLSGDEIKKEHASIMFGFYRNTIEKMSAIPYLNEVFFETIFRTMPDRLLLCLAYDDDTPVAGSISFHKGSKLFGRYWGCAVPYKNLHFELCYYQTIEFAIERKIQLFEAGAQGPHKLQRGFLAALTHSAHEIFHSGFREAIDRFIAEEAKAIESGVADAKTPFKVP